MADPPHQISRPWRSLRRHRRAQTIPTWIDSDNYAMEYNRKFFLNGANIGLYIQTNSNVEGQIDRIKNGMRTEYAGNENAHKIPALPKGAELKHTGVTHKDMDFKDLAEATHDRILAGLRVSKMTTDELRAFCGVFDQIEAIDPHQCVRF